MMNIEMSISEDNSVGMLSWFAEKRGLTDLYSAYEKISVAKNIAEDYSLIRLCSD
jgi:hypothetical protein